jgi:hypothetical protein
MKSPHHHENIMATDVSHVGIGIVPGGVQDPRNLSVTQLFARPAKEETEAQVRASLGRAINAARQQSSRSRLENDAKLSALAERYIGEIDVANFDSSVSSIGNEIPGQLGTSPVAGISSVLVGGQLLPDSSGFAVPAPLLEERAASLGFAVRRVAGANQRPAWAVLLLVGMK